MKELSTQRLTDPFGAYMSSSADALNFDTAFIDTLSRDSLSPFANEDGSLTKSFSVCLKGSDLTDADKKRLSDSFKIADKRTAMKPVDWFDNTCPRQYLSDGKIYTFNRYDETKGVNIFVEQK